MVLRPFRCVIRQTSPANELDERVVSDAKRLLGVEEPFCTISSSRVEELAYYATVIPSACPSFCSRSTAASAMTVPGG